MRNVFQGLFLRCHRERPFLSHVMKISFLQKTRERQARKCVLCNAHRRMQTEARVSSILESVCLFPDDISCRLSENRSPRLLHELSLCRSDTLAVPVSSTASLPSSQNPLVVSAVPLTFLSCVDACLGLLNLTEERLCSDSPEVCLSAEPLRRHLHALRAT